MGEPFPVSRAGPAVAALLVIASSAALAIDITDCGTVVPRREIGVLQVDLDCSASPSPFAVKLEDRATLELNGHSIDGSIMGVECSRRRNDYPLPSYCTINGPGEIFGAVDAAVYGERVGTVVVRGVHLHDSGRGIGRGATWSSKRLVLTDVTVSDNAGRGIVANLVRALNLIVDNNGEWGISAGRLMGESISASGNVIGVQANDVRVIGLTANGNGEYGVRSDRATLEDSVVLGNGFFDLQTIHPPRLVNTSCGTSNWGVCSND